jgi:hypothetical protein
MLTALVGRFGFHKTAVRCALCAGTPFVLVLFHHIFVALQNLRFRLFGLQKRRLPGTLCERKNRRVHKILLISIDK